jgi:hypothetical protein
LNVGPLLSFEDFTSVLLSPGYVTGLSQGESSDGVCRPCNDDDDDDEKYKILKHPMFD